MRNLHRIVKRVGVVTSRAFAGVMTQHPGFLKPGQVSDFPEQGVDDREPGPEEGVSFQVGHDLERAGPRVEKIPAKLSRGDTIRGGIVGMHDVAYSMPQCRGSSSLAQRVRTWSPETPSPRSGGDGCWSPSDTRCACSPSLAGNGATSWSPCTPPKARNRSRRRRHATTSE